MRTAAIIGIALLATSVFAKPMTGSVRSWEGEFLINRTNMPIRIRGLPGLILWKYDLQNGSGGTAVGYSTDAGDMLRAPTPQGKGVQPIYTGHIVVVNDDDSADILVTYRVQGNGGWQVVEKYHYTGTTITLASTTMNSGKPRFEWFREEEGTDHRRERTDDPKTANQSGQP